MKRAVVLSALFLGACGGEAVPDPVSGDGGSVLDSGSNTGEDSSTQAESGGDTDGSVADSGVDATLPQDGGVDGSDAAHVADAADEADASASGGTRPVSPLSTALVTSQKPTFRWALTGAATGAQVDICKDRACGSTVVTFLATGSSGAPPSALSHGVYFWRIHAVVNGAVAASASPVWEFRVGALSATVDTSWGTFPDPNGDGFADLIIGSTTGTSVSIYLSAGAAGLSSSAIATSLTAPANGTLGSSVASAGDLNGDGFADLVVGSPGANSGAGAAYVYFGGPQISTTPNATLQTSQAGSAFGSSVSSAGDVNHDGYADVLIGASGVNSNTGAGYVYMGGPNGPSTVAGATLPGLAAASNFGISVASAGDLNGDGYGDVIVGAPGPLPSGFPFTGTLGQLPSNVGTGDAYLYLGSANGLVTSPPTTLVGPSGNFGQFVANAGDVNGDGFADLLVGAPVASEAYVYLGSPGGVASTTAEADLLGPPVSTISVQNFGVVMLGDVNGDGFADAVVGAPTYGSSTDGRTYVYLSPGGGAFSSSTSAPAAPSAALLSPGSEKFFGEAVGMGDVNGDGYADLAIGGTITATGSGSASVFLGISGTSGVSTTSAATLAAPPGTLGGVQ